MHEHNWSENVPAVGDQLTLGNTTVTRLSDLDMALVSGDIAHFAERHGALESVGLAQYTADDSSLLRLSRNRAVWLSPGDSRPPDGWHDGVAISTATGGFAHLQLDGPGAEHLLAQGTTADLRAGSPSAAVRFAGQQALLCRRDATWWLFVDAPLLAYHWTWFRGADAADFT